MPPVLRSCLRPLVVWGLLAAGPTLAASPELAAELRFLVASGQAREAATRSAAALSERPDDLVLVALHARAVAALGEGAALARSIDPAQGSVARVAWTAAMAEGVSEPSEICAPLDQWVDRETPAEVWRGLLEVRPRLDEVCSDWTAGWWLLAAGRLGENAEGLSVQVGAADAAWGEAVEAWVASDPVDLTQAGNPWSTEAAGLGLVRGRVALAAAASEAAESTDAPRLWWAREVWRWQGLDTEMLDNTLAQVAPDVWEAGWSTAGAVRWQPPRVEGAPEQWYRLQELAGIPDPDRRATGLRTLDALLPAEGPLRAEWWTLRAGVAEAQGRGRAEVRARQEAWRANPADARLANRFAWAAATHRVRMDAALEAINQALVAPAPYRPERGGPSADAVHRWSEGHAVGARLDTRGWLRFQLGDVEGARADLDRALMLYRSPSATVHLHAGLVAHAARDIDAALFHLREGFAVVDARHDDAELVSTARSLVDALYAEHRWHPGGVEGWLKARSKDLDRPPASGPMVNLDQFAEALVQAPPRLPVQGGPIPELMLDVDGTATGLAEVEGWRVVELWAAWCASCHLQIGAMLDLHAELDAAQVPVTVVVVSVEEAPRSQWPVGLVGQPGPRWVVAWGGPSVVDRLGAAGLPATLLIDPQGRVVDSRTGWEGNLNWVRDALEAAGLQPSEAADD